MPVLEYVYVVSVKVYGSFGSNKTIQKRRVLSLTKAYVTVDDFGSKIKLPADRCFADLESARKAAEERAGELIVKLQQAIDSLKLPARYDERVRGIIEDKDLPA